jgi:hypothetical protein
MLSSRPFRTESRSTDGQALPPRRPARPASPAPAHLDAPPCRVDARGPAAADLHHAGGGGARGRARGPDRRRGAGRHRARRRTRGRSPDGEVVVSSGTIATRASDEYRYVSRDLRRIAVVGGFLIAVMVVLEILVNALHLFTL